LTPNWKTPEGRLQEESGSESIFLLLQRSGKTACHPEHSEASLHFAFIWKKALSSRPNDLGRVRSVLLCPALLYLAS